jgi:hypothetical protein
VLRRIERVGVPLLTNGVIAMVTKLASCFVALGLGALLAGCSEMTTEQKMQKYMESYYPSSGDNLYEVAFDWGAYVIKTEAVGGAAAQGVNTAYRGYIVMRPRPKAKSTEQGLAVYLINPKGEVWKTGALAEIPLSKQRDEVVVIKEGNSTSTSTKTIHSVSEPVIDHFLDKKSQWRRHGVLERNGDKSTLKLAT